MELARLVMYMKETLPYQRDLQAMLRFKGVGVFAVVILRKRSSCWYYWYLRTISVCFRLVYGGGALRGVILV